MKRLTIIKFSLLLVSFFVLNIVNAKNIYLATNGVDTNDGLGALTPVATLSNAYAKAQTGDIIKISGLIDFSVDPTLTTTPKAGLVVDREITIEGTSNATDGLDGKQLTRFFQLNKGATLTLRNLAIRNGSYNAVQGGGAMYINGGGLNCEEVVFDNNSVNYSNLSATGGVFRVDLTSGLSFNKCTFTNNSGNIAGVLYLSDTGNPDVNISFTSCAFISNISNGKNGGVVSYISLTDASTNNTISFVNCTMTKNQVTADSNGGVFFLTKSHSSVKTDIINCTISDNSGAGLINRGAGIRVLTAYYGQLNIYNSIIEGNMTLQKKAYSDIIYAFTPTAATLNIKNSIIGRSAGQTIPTECYAGNNYFNYLIDSSIELDLIAYFASFDATKNVYPILPGSAAINLGDAQYLQALNIDTDQSGTVRPFTNGKCHAGAAEIVGTITNPDGSPAENYEHFIMYGQSLSTGHQAWPVISTENIPGNYMLGDQIWINYGNSNPTIFNSLIGTVSNDFKNQQGIRSREAGTIAECPLFGAVNHIQLKQQGSKILATSAGTSGMTIEQLSKESQTKTLYNDFVNAVKYAAAIARNTNKIMSCPAIFFLQGEWNYQGYEQGLTLNSKPTSDKDAYKALMLQLKDNMQSEAQFRYGQEEKPLFITYQCGAQYIKGKEQTIGMAQLEASNEHEDIVCAGSIYPMSDRGGHLDPNGYRWYGEMLGKVYYQTKVLAEKFKPLQPMEISRTESTNKIRIKFLVKHLPLVLDQSIVPKKIDFGFEVYVNNIKRTISNISVVDDCVYITTSGSTVGNVEVVYAGQNCAGTGNLRDSDPYQSFFNYIDLDMKNADNSYVFPRDATETTLRPSYEPKNSSGTVIYDQPYPLYNFSVSFYYKLPSDVEVYTIPNVEKGTGISNTYSDKEVAVFQSNKVLTITTDLQNLEPLNVSIFNTSGQLINSFSMMVGNGKNRKEYSLSDLQPGAYLANIASKTNSKTVKLILD